MKKISKHVTVTCCAVFMPTNWCCPSAPHTYPNALLSVTSLAMKEILFTTCSCSITWIEEKCIVKRTQGCTRCDGDGGEKQGGAGLTPDLSSMILIPDKEMLTQILCLCLPWDRAATAIPWWKKNKTHRFIFPLNTSLIKSLYCVRPLRPLLWQMDVCSLC